MIMEAEKSHNLPSASWSCRKPESRRANRAEDLRARGAPRRSAFQLCRVS